jgi:hypothetical protein
VYIGFFGEVEKEYITFKEYDLSNVQEVECENISQRFICKETRLNSVELIFTQIPEDKVGAIALAIYKQGEEDKILYQSNISLSNLNDGEWKKVYVNAEMESETEYVLTLTANESCTQIPSVLVLNDVAEEIEKSYQGKMRLNGNVAINYGYLKAPTLFDRLVRISLCGFFLYAVWLFLRHFEIMRNGIQMAWKRIGECAYSDFILVAFEIFTAMIWISSSGIEFEDTTKIISYIISLLAVLYRKQKEAYIRSLQDKGWKSILFYVMYCYAAFALVGQRIWIYPLTLRVTIAGIFVYLITVIWMIPVVNSCIYLLYRASTRFFQSTKTCPTWKFLIFTTGLLILPAIYNLIANNPGISTPDTVSTMVQSAPHLRGASDWHPVFYSMVLRVIQEVSNTTYAVIFVQYFFWLYIINELLLYLKKRGISQAILICIAGLLGFNAANVLHLNTIWKDIPYTLSVVWALILLGKLVIDYEGYRKKWYVYLEFLVAMVGVCLYRKNGAVTFCIIAIAVILLLWKNKRALLSVICSILVIGIVKGPIYSYYEVVDTGRRGIYIGLGQDILGVYYAGGEVSEETLAMITMMTAQNNAEYTYTPTWSNAAYEVDVTPMQFIVSYLDTFVKNPIYMVRAVIAREDALWNVFEGKDAVLGCVNATSVMRTSEWNDVYPDREYTSLYPRMSDATSYTASKQWLAAIEWRCGLLTLCGLIASIFAVLKLQKGKYVLLFAPILGHILSLLLSTGWSDFRYYWPLNLMNVVLILYVILLTRQEKE